MTPKEKQSIITAYKNSSKNNLLETLSMEFVDVGDVFLTIKMPVTSKVHQPDGLLHGGATAALVETVGSMASFVFLKRKNIIVRGLEMSINHIRSISEGEVFATARIIHFGKTTQVWEVRVTDKDSKLISYSKFTTIALADARE